METEQKKLKQSKNRATFVKKTEQKQSISTKKTEQNGILNLQLHKHHESL